MRKKCYKVVKMARNLRRPLNLVFTEIFMMIYVEVIKY